MLNKVLCKLKTRKDKEAMSELITVSQPLLRLIKQCCDEDYEKADKISEDDFDCPNWALKRAYQDGLKKGLTKLSEYVIINSEN